MSAWPSGRLSKAASAPSGDHRGVPVRAPPIRESWKDARPDESLTQISLLPDQLERNAMRPPSGEMDGLESYCVEEITFRGADRPVRSNRQMLVSSKNWA